ncbi:uncharacterized protein LOC143246198 [Tachypleus tridentatus]|uniref:uncharacterized protein LOC143246198 n=1 Tax=Tachypleus tridentatus TaxID=6853 RepID=UPI003FD55154
MVVTVNKNVPADMMENINQRLGHFIQSGIFQKEVEKVTQNATRCIEGLSPQVMLHPQCLDDLKGVFLLWIGGVVLATLVFILETLVFKLFLVSTGNFVLDKR